MHDKSKQIQINFVTIDLIMEKRNFLKRTKKKKIRMCMK